MRRLVNLGLVLAAGFLVSPVQVHAQNGDRDFTLVNETRWDINAVFFSTSNDKTWYRSRGTRVNSRGETDISFDNSGSCNLQMRLEFSNGSTPEWRRGIDLCNTSRVVVSYNGDGTFNAHSE